MGILTGRIGVSEPSGGIVLFIPQLDGGGAQKVVVNLANSLVDLSHHRVQVVVASARGPFVKELRNEVELIDLGKLRTLGAIIPLAKHLRRTRPIVLCSSLNYANICSTLAWSLAGRRCRLVLREDNVIRVPSGSSRSRLWHSAKRFMMRVTYSRANLIVAISEAVASSLVEYRVIRRRDIKVIGNPISFEASKASDSTLSDLGLPAGARFICSIGRLTEQKGFDILIEAFSRIHRHGQDELYLVILGEGPLRQSLENMTARLGISDRVIMPGFVDRPGEILSRSSLFVLSSRWEGFGNVLVEALASGVPIVSTDCPGAPRELLLEGQLGYLVPSEEPERLAEAILNALDSPRSTGDARQRRANDFSAPVIAQRYLTEAFELPVITDEKQLREEY